jgi:hypothetical protein
MKKLLSFIGYALLFFTIFVYPKNLKRLSKQQSDRKVEISMTKMTHLFKSVLSNGMTVLVRPVHEIPKVSLQLWYHVGSKDDFQGYARDTF